MASRKYRERAWGGRAAPNAGMPALANCGEDKREGKRQGCSC